MKGPIKSVLEEELQNSLRMIKQYEISLKNLPKGSLSKKLIRGHDYYYLAKREGDKVRFYYLGKLSSEKVKKYKKDQMLRAKHKKLLSQARKQAKFLKGCLRGREPI